MKHRILLIPLLVLFILLLLLILLLVLVLILLLLLLLLISRRAGSLLGRNAVLEFTYPCRRRSRRDTGGYRSGRRRRIRIRGRRRHCHGAGRILEQRPPWR